LTDVDPFTIEEREIVIEGFRQYAPLYVNYVICGFWTGWRPSEACALKWSRVDFQQGKILIREGRVLGQTGIPKAAGSLRDIDLLPPVREALSAHSILKSYLEILREAASGNDLPPVFVPNFKLELGSSQARDPGGA
jgi:integrase